MKEYKDYMDSFSASEELQHKTLTRIDNAVAAHGKIDSPRRGRRELRFLSAIPAWARVACTAVLLIIVLSASAYAVYSYVTWTQTGSADSGGSFVMEPVEKEEFDSYLESTGTVSLRTIYRYNFNEQPIVDEETMRVLNKYLKDRVFTADGAAFELFVPVSGGYQANDKGCTLYDEAGRVIGDIRANNVGTAAPNGITILSVAEVEKWFAFTDTYDEAVAFLGKDFRLPTVLTDGFSPPAFRKNGDETLVKATGRRAIYISLDGEPGMYYFVETNRDASADATVWYATDSVITEGEIAGVSVSKISSEDLNRYTWSLDGLTYMFFQFKSHPVSVNCFSDEQCEKIIRSMIE